MDEAPVLHSKILSQIRKRAMLPDLPGNHGARDLKQPNKEVRALNSLRSTYFNLFPPLP